MEFDPKKLIRHDHRRRVAARRQRAEGHALIDRETRGRERCRTDQQDSEKYP
jgi:hypothetical protein